MFDLEKYTLALEKFVHQLQISQFSIPVNAQINIDYQDVLEDLCESLRVSKIEVKKTPLAVVVMDHGELEHVFFESGDVDETRTFLVTQESKNIVRADYTFYQSANDEEDWSLLETDRMQAVSELLYTFESCFLLINHANFLRGHDVRFKNIMNTQWMHELLEFKIRQKSLSNFGFAFFNIHNFANINRKFGKKKSDEILERYLEDMKKIVESPAAPEESGCVSALGGDNGLVLFHKNTTDELIAYFKLAVFSVEHNGTIERLNMASHAGINLNLEEYETSYEIINSVSAPLGVSKNSPGTGIIFNDKDFRKKQKVKKNIEDWFLDALRNEEFLVYYQPKFDIMGNKLVGAEALVRWVHDGKMIFPDQFIPVIEGNHMIKHLDIYMLDHVCSHIAQWQKQKRDICQISVNLSRASLEIFDTVSVLTSIIDKHGISRSLIQIEITESASDADNIELQNLVNGLADEGISVAVDDFGTGFSSLSLIKDLPWDMLKIDRTFLRGATEKGSRDQLMFKSIISLANEINLACIVEGVETKDDVELLKESGCFLAQGYFYSKPVPHADFTQMLGQKKSGLLHRMTSMEK